MREAATEGYTTATAVADALVRRGVPFRTAHHIVGSLVAQAEGERPELDAIPDAMVGRRARCQRRPGGGGPRGRTGIGDELRAAASLDGALASCDVIGGTAPTRVAAALVGGKARGARACGRSRPSAARKPPGDSRTSTEAPDAHDTIRQAPKALLHDHLDGGLRPATVIDLAAEHGYDALPTTDVDELAAWFRRGADRKSLELYLETFAHTVGVMQWPDAIARVAAECAEDLAADGVVYAEVRMAPELCTERGLTLDEAVAAMLEGFRIGSVRAAEAGHPIVMKLLVTAMRQAARSVEVAECAVRWRDAGVVGFDIAGPEAGYRADPPPRRVRVRPPRELPHHDPRRRVVRAAVDLGGAPVVRRRAPRPRRPDRRRHHGPRRRLVELGRPGGVRARPARPARDVPDLERPHRRRAVDRRAPDRPAPAASLPGHASTPTTG